MASYFMDVRMPTTVVHTFSADPYGEWLFIAECESLIAISLDERKISIAYHIVKARSWAYFVVFVSSSATMYDVSSVMNMVDESNQRGVNNHVKIDERQL